MAGVECLAGIPGSVGGTPVQNVGAYGQEVAETIESGAGVRSREAGVSVNSGRRRADLLIGAACSTTDGSRTVHCDAGGFRLAAGRRADAALCGLQKRIAGKWTSRQPSLVDVAAAVREMRQAKGMLLVEGDPDCRSAGSFFKNPVVSEAGRVLRVAAGEWRSRKVSALARRVTGQVKLPAAWLIGAGWICEGLRAGTGGDFVAAYAGADQSGWGDVCGH